MQNETKVVMVINSELPAGVIANTAAVLGITIGQRAPQYVGRDVTDASGSVHAGIVTIPVPILKSGGEDIRALRTELGTDAYSGVLVIDFSDVAQGCKTYDEYIEKSAVIDESAHSYLGLAIVGDKKKVNKLTGSMPLLR